MVGGGVTVLADGRTDVRGLDAWCSDNLVYR